MEDISPILDIQNNQDLYFKLDENKFLSICDMYDHCEATRFILQENGKLVNKPMESKNLIIIGGIFGGLIGLLLLPFIISYTFWFLTRAILILISILKSIYSGDFCKTLKKYRDTMMGKREPDNSNTASDMPHMINCISNFLPKSNSNRTRINSIHERQQCNRLASSLETLPRYERRYFTTNNLLPHESQDQFDLPSYHTSYYLNAPLTQERTMNEENSNHSNNSDNRGIIQLPPKAVTIQNSRFLTEHPIYNDNLPSIQKSEGQILKNSVKDEDNVSVKDGVNVSVKYDEYGSNSDSIESSSGCSSSCHTVNSNSLSNSYD
ncbi:hypothetical protein TBLA_0F00600 [Henningerozyma blattae CBS 6284]|uniref:Uncharacterized protein n=1 Tax=Henningerozyma blattae (strain ATCC 34711 / CBS 6284 / DSM 70876 / NBRC 10599 / NRRL Y-10934 / UCD 77-7) TaxID=1071380 RepID=I2H5F3_HENB6|nr:hypothetical protein TBLA_0F00600 [Tetrapisispora blattae CBS 6284]CCH61605.1 hypothetical protein TBLA_0F00600 [Tetrapisispora blattae CBS 6284]